MPMFRKKLTGVYGETDKEGFISVYPNLTRNVLVYIGNALL